MPGSEASSQPTREAVLRQLDALLASTPLRESHQLQAFLDFVVHETLAGRQDGLKEYTLGCRVFGRREDYDPRHDGIVRVQATTLRKRLEKYYTGDGKQDTVVIALPRGGYVPSFTVRADDDDARAVTTVWPRRRIAVVAALSGMALMGLIWLFWTIANPVARPFSISGAAPTDFPQLWGPFFQPGSRTLVGCGVPLFYSSGGLYLRDVHVNLPGQESEGRIDEFAEKFKVRPQPSDDTYTGVGEMVGTNLVSNFLTTRGTPVRVANAHTIGESALTGTNAVVISSLRFRTLLTALHLPSTFEFVGMTPETIRDLAAPPGGRREYVFSGGTGIDTSYALVSLWPGITRGNRILWIGGVHTWATQAATEFLVQPEQLRKVARVFSSDGPGGPHGTPSPYFQILLKVEGRQNRSLEVEYVTHHYLPANTRPKP